MKPLIGITTYNEVKPKKVYSSVSYNYSKSIEMAGGVPVLIPIGHDEQNLDVYIDRLDGIIFSGGEDISPIQYGESPLKQVTMISEDRDNHEIMLLRKALMTNMPILGICRGIQLLNVEDGGTLYQDHNLQRGNDFGHMPLDSPVDNLYHYVNIEENTIVYNIFGEKHIAVNSFHHQSIKDLGKSYIISSKSDDGIIESIERKGQNFVVGVQWHPEDLTLKHNEFLKLFKVFIEAANNYI